MGAGHHLGPFVVLGAHQTRALLGIGLALLALVQRAYVLEGGTVLMRGTSAELANNKQVPAAYPGI